MVVAVLAYGGIGALDTLHLLCLLLEPLALDGGSHPSPFRICFPVSAGSKLLHRLHK
jgi:hypothetical protein